MDDKKTKNKKNTDKNNIDKKTIIKVDDVTVRFNIASERIDNLKEY